MTTIKTTKIQNPFFGADPEFASGYLRDGIPFILPPVFFRVNLEVPVKENENHPIFAEYDGTLVHEDGAAFEMSTPPSYDWRKIFSNIQNAKANFSRDVLSKFPEHCLPELLSLPTVNYDCERWINAGPHYTMCTVFGCDPDKDVYNTKSRGGGVMDASLHPERYMGGHIHVSKIDAIAESPLIAIRCMVLTAGLAATAFSDTPDLDKRRLFLYGKPGKFRIQKYKDGTSGVEYRTPSTRWTNDETIAERVFSWATIGMTNLLQEGLFESIAKKVEKDAVQAIMEFDQDSAGNILDFIAQKV